MTKRSAAYPWVRYRIVNNCALIGVPVAWTLSVRVVELEKESRYKVGEVVTWHGGQTATVPVGLMDIRLRKGRHAS